MANKVIKTRIQNKHAFESEWINSDFVPMRGELIVYDAEITSAGVPLVDLVDGQVELPDGSRREPYNYARVKVGDGLTTAHLLSFTSSDSGVDSETTYSSTTVSLPDFNVWDYSYSIRLTNSTGTALCESINLTNDNETGHLSTSPEILFSMSHDYSNGSGIFTFTINSVDTYDDLYYVEVIRGNNVAYRVTLEISHQSITSSFEVTSERTSNTIQIDLYKSGAWIDLCNSSGMSIATHTDYITTSTGTVVLSTNPLIEMSVENVSSTSCRITFILDPTRSSYDTSYTVYTLYSSSDSARRTNKIVINTSDVDNIQASLVKTYHPLSDYYTSSVNIEEEWNHYLPDWENVEYYIYAGSSASTSQICAGNFNTSPCGWGYVLLSNPYIEINGVSYSDTLTFIYNSAAEMGYYNDHYYITFWRTTSGYTNSPALELRLTFSETDAGRYTLSVEFVRGGDGSGDEEQGGGEQGGGEDPYPTFDTSAWYHYLHRFNAYSSSTTFITVGMDGNNGFVSGDIDETPCSEINFSTRGCSTVRVTASYTGSTDEYGAIWEVTAESYMQYGGSYTISILDPSGAWVDQELSLYCEHMVDN